jgi:hypothetical protein
MLIAFPALHHRLVALPAATIYPTLSIFGFLASGLAAIAAAFLFVLSSQSVTICLHHSANALQPSSLRCTVAIANHRWLSYEYIASSSFLRWLRNEYFASSSFLR